MLAEPSRRRSVRRTTGSNRGNGHSGSVRSPSHRRRGRRRLRRGLHRRRCARDGGVHGRGPRRRPEIPLPAPDRLGKTIAAAGFVEAARHLGILILTHRRLLVSQFNRDLTTEGYGEPQFTDAIVAGSARRRRRTRSRSRRTRGSPATAPSRSQGVPPRDLRRGAHRARREDERRHSGVLGAALHRDDRDGAAHLKQVSDVFGVGRRPSARRRRPTRSHRAASLPCACRLRLPSTRCPSSAATSRSAPRGRARPPGAQPRGRRASTASASARRPASCTQRASSTYNLAQEFEAAGLKAEAVSGRTAPARLAGRSRTSEARSTCSSTRCCSPRAGTLRARRSACTSLRPRRGVYQQRIGRIMRIHYAGGRRRSRLRPEARRTRASVSSALLGKLLPRGSPRHARAATSSAASRASQAVAGAVARSGHPRRGAQARGDPARVAADRPEVPRRRRAAVPGDDRGSPDPRRPARRVREEVRRGPGRERRARAVPRPAPPRIRTAGCA